MKTTWPTILAKTFFLFNQFKNMLLKLIKTRPYDILLIAAIIIYGTVFSYFTTLKHNVFQSYAWDLGIFNQALYTTLHNGRLLYYTVELFLNPTGSFFALHVSPILFLILPLYAINPSPTTLLVIKSFALGAGALPLYLLSKELIRNKKASLMFALIYLLYPPLQGANWFDFQPQIFIPFLFFSMHYFMIKKRWKLYFSSMALTLMIMEQLPLIVFLFAAFCLINAKIGLRKSIKRLKLSESLVSLITMIVCMIYFPATIYIKNLFPISPEFLERYVALANFSVLGVEGDPLLTPIYAIMNPQRAFQALMYDYHIKFFYILLAFGPLLFISFRNKLCLVALAFLTPLFLSNYLPYYTVGAHYPLYILALIFIGAIYALKHLQLESKMFTLKTMLAVALVFVISTSPLSPVSNAFIKEELLWYPTIDFTIDENINSLHALINLIPSHASILTQNHIFPHVSSRINAYVLPFYRVGDEYASSLMDKSEYILLDFSYQDPMRNLVFNKISSDNSFGVYALATRAVLFRRDYDGEPMFAHYTEQRVLLAYKDLTTASSAKLVLDPSTTSEHVVLYPQEAGDGVFAFGPYACLLQGTYNATFKVKTTEHNTNSQIGTLDVSYDYGNRIISKRNIYGFELKPHEWTNFTLSFTVTGLTTGVEFRAFSSGASDLYIDRISVKRVSTVAETEFGLRTFTPKDLMLVSGSMNEEGIFVHERNTTSQFFWYGPYESLPPGSFNVTFFLAVSPPPSNNDRILTLEITSDLGDNVLGVIDVNSSTFINSYQNSDWHRFTIHFVSEEYLNEVEFRGIMPSPNYEIRLAFILLEKVG
ncbi:MAG: DUF2079 domain-containing protein [Candidatus Bathyarchaeia archaeon]